MAQYASEWMNEPRQMRGRVLCASFNSTRSPYRGSDVRIILTLACSTRASAIFATNWCSSMTSTPARSGMPAHFGIRIADADKDKLVGELDVDDRHLNNSGHVHGGALAAFADDLGGSLAGLNVAPGFRTTTIESKTNIFRACVPGRLTGVAVPVHVGRRTIVLQTSIYRADGKLAAMMIQTQMVLPRRSASSGGEGGDEA